MKVLVFVTSGVQNGVNNDYRRVATVTIFTMEYAEKRKIGARTVGRMFYILL